MSPRARVALLTAGRDKPYAFGLAAALIERSRPFDFIGSDAVDGREVDGGNLVTVFNLRGDQATNAPFARKVTRILGYYSRLIRYAATRRAGLLHILWNNKFEFFDRTILMLYYRLLGYKVVLTAHNVNIGKRDRNDTLLNRLSLRCQYRLSHHIFVHTQRMVDELAAEFGATSSKVSLIPFGINSTVPKTALTSAEAKRRLDLAPNHRAILFFGNIAPYKGLDDLVSAMSRLQETRGDYRLIIAGQPKGGASHWNDVRCEIGRARLEASIVERASYIPDDEIEIYFKAADVLVLPYTRIFQSGVLFLGYNFGLPAIATDVGALADDVVAGLTGLVCRPRDPEDLARAIAEYFDSQLYRQLDAQRTVIERFANERYSWRKVGEITESVYRRLLAEA